MGKDICIPVMTARQLRLSESKEAVFIIPVRGANPPYAAGDILFVKEPWRQQPTEWDEKEGYSEFEVQYQGEFTAQEDSMYGRMGGLMPWPWSSPKDMPAEMCGITAQVLSIQETHLQDITVNEIDDMGEIHCEPSEACESMLCGDCPQSGEDPLIWFKWAWNKNIPSESADALGWDNDPPVWLIRLKLHSVRKDKAKPTMDKVVLPRFFTGFF